MMPQFAMMFPGQGSQTVGMLQALAQRYSIIQSLFKQASDLLGEDLWQIAQQDVVKLNQTVYTQPIMLVADVALFHCWRQHTDAMPVVMMGHSLGEYSALVCADALDFEQAVKLVALRARYMQDAVAMGEGAMAAIVGLSDEQVMTLCEQAKQGDEVAPANYNAIGQIVIAGHRAAVERAVELAKELDAKIAKIIPVSVPSHCILMQTAATKLAKDIAQVRMGIPKVPVLQNYAVCAYDQVDSVKDALVQQLVQPVQWVKTIKSIAKMQINCIIECGPGKVLSGLTRRIEGDIKVYPTFNELLLKTALQAVE